MSEGIKRIGVEYLHILAMCAVMFVFIVIADKIKKAWRTKHPSKKELLKCDKQIERALEVGPFNRATHRMAMVKWHFVHELSLTIMWANVLILLCYYAKATFFNGVPILQSIHFYDHLKILMGFSVISLITRVIRDRETAKQRIAFSIIGGVQTYLRQLIADDEMFYDAMAIFCIMLDSGTTIDAFNMIADIATSRDMTVDEGRMVTMILIDDFSSRDDGDVSINEVLSDNGLRLFNEVRALAENEAAMQLSSEQQPSGL